MAAFCPYFKGTAVEIPLNDIATPTGKPRSKNTTCMTVFLTELET